MNDYSFIKKIDTLFENNVYSYKELPKTGNLIGLPNGKYKIQLEFKDIFNRNEFCLGVSPNIKEEIIICEKKNTIILSGTKKEILENFKKINYLAQNVGWERIKYGFIKDLK